MFKHAIAPVLALTATIGLFTIPGAAFAETAGNSVAVRFADLDLGTPDGQQQLDRRIARAARQVCALDDIATGTRIRSSEADACYRQALRNVRTSVAEAVSASRKGG